MISGGRCVTTDRRRKALVAIVESPESTPDQFLRACELLDRLDARDPSARDRDFFADLDGLTEVELAAFGVPPVFVIEQHPAFGERVEQVARQLADERARLQQEPHPVAAE